MEHSRIIHHYWTSPCGILDLASIGDAACNVRLGRWLASSGNAQSADPTDQASYGRRCLIGY